MKKETFLAKHPSAAILCGEDVDMAYITPVVVEILEELAERGFCRPCKCKGRGRYSCNDDRTMTIAFLLKKSGVDFITINDAKRGSATGNVIILSKKCSFGSCWSRTISDDGEEMLHFAGEYITTSPVKEKFLPASVVTEINKMIAAEV